MHKYGESKTPQIMMTTVRHVTSSSGLSGRLIFVEQRVQFCSQEYTLLQSVHRITAQHISR